MKTEQFVGPPWWVVRPLELLTAFVMVYVLTAFIDQNERERFDAIAPEEWFEVIELYVPDHEAGEDPLLAYDRDIRADFRGYWVVEIKNRNALVNGGRFFTACSGNGASDYDPGDVLDPAKVTWTWFIGRPCEVPPGIYRMEVTWDMKVPESDKAKRYTALSNAFRVYEPGTMPRR